jgi:uncharacterized protein (UPF0332 family)
VNPEAAAFWGRALRALQTAEQLVDSDPDASASRAYYAAFYAVSAHFALSGRTFTKHSGVEAAVHRDLVRSGIWDTSLGRDYTKIFDLRGTSDYGGVVQVTQEEAHSAVEAAGRILEAVRKMSFEARPACEER